MIFGPKRGSALYIFDNFFKDFSLLIIALIIGFASGDIVEALTSNAGVVVIVLIAPVARLLDYLFTKFEVDDEKLIIRSGVFKKSIVEVPLATITTVDMSQSIICQVFNAYKMKVDNASNISADNSRTKISMIFRSEDAFKLKSTLESGKKGANGLNLASQGEVQDGKEAAPRCEIGESYSISSLKILEMGLLESKGVLIAEGIGLVTVVTGFLSERMMDDFWSLVVSLSGVFVCGGIVVFAMLILIMGGIGSMIRYLGFTVENRSKDININYGLITKKSFTLNKDRISGFAYQQSWLMRKFHVGTVEVFAIGFGLDSDDSKERAVIHPLIKESELKEFLSHFMDDFNYDCELEKPEGRSLKYFFYRVSFIFALLLMGASIVVSALWVRWAWILGALTLGFSIAGRIMEFKNTRAGGNEHNFQITSGGLKTQRTFIKTDNVEAITDVASRWKRKKKIVTLAIDFLGPFATTTVEARNLSQDVCEKLRQLLVY